jgi:hypothetical protein
VVLEVLVLGLGLVELAATLLMVAVVVVVELAPRVVLVVEVVMGWL